MLLGEDESPEILPSLLDPDNTGVRKRILWQSKQVCNDCTYAQVVPSINIFLEDFFMSQKTKLLVEGAAMVALATVLSFIRIIKMPWGGSVTLLSMLPIVIFSIKNGVKNGLIVSFAFSLVQFAQGVMDGLFGWGLTPVSS